jgi:hypothetical protein
MLDLKKVVKNMRTMKTLLKHSFLTPSIRNKIENTGNHIIDLEESVESEQLETFNIEEITNNVVINHSTLGIQP